jgi:4-amino-4-deoxy-L-arabinose transferase-like glycosyltransferase
VDEAMADSIGTLPRTEPARAERSHVYYLIVVLVASAIYLGCVFSPPSLMDDVDAVQAQIARNMLTSGDWVTAHIDRIAYMEKPPLIYWVTAASYKIFGVHDWSARLPIVLSAIGLCWLTAAFGIWAFGKRAGFYAGLCMATCVGLFLFTRIIIPDVMLTFTIALALWAFLRAIDEEEKHPLLWSILLAVNLGLGLLLKSLIGVLFPVAAALLYLLFTRQLFSAKIWRRLHPFLGTAIILAVAAPWHILATLRNPPTFAWTLHSGPGDYHGFLWFFFINEQLLRFLNMRYPRDYNTVPRAYFWLFHLIWMFPWSVYLAAVVKQCFGKRNPEASGQSSAPGWKPIDRAGRARLLALCWIGFILVFFTFSTTQEYYSMPCYPAFALLIGSAMAAGGVWVRRGTRVLAAVTACAAIAAFALIFYVRHVATPGDISMALGHHPKAYSLSLGHMEDLTLDSFAYLRIPLLIAGIAFLVGALGTFRWVGQRAYLAAALMMVLFFHAARLAMVTFDPYLSSRTLARALVHDPPGTLISQGHYYEFSSVFFYDDRTSLLITDRRINLDYGSYAPGAPHMFITDSEFKSLWLAPARCYFLVKDLDLPKFQAIVGAAAMSVVVTSGGKTLFTNHPLPASTTQLLPRSAFARRDAILKFRLGRRWGPAASALPAERNVGLFGGILKGRDWAEIHEP